MGNAGNVLFSDSGHRCLKSHENDKPPPVPIVHTVQLPWVHIHGVGQGQVQNYLCTEGLF